MTSKPEYPKLQRISLVELLTSEHTKDEEYVRYSDDLLLIPREDRELLRHTLEEVWFHETTSQTQAEMMERVLPVLRGRESEAE